MASGGDTGFTAAVATEAGAAEQLNQIMQAWGGGEDRGVPLDLTEVEHATSYAVDVRNKETGSSLVARFRNAANEVLLTLVKEAVTIGKALTCSGTATFVGAVTLPDSTVATAKIADNAVDDTKVGNRVPALTRRQGGSATAWGDTGTTDYTPTTVRIQAGTLSMGFIASGALASEVVTFPVAFSDTPLVFVQGRNSDAIYPGWIITDATIIGAASFVAKARNTHASLSVSIAMNWLAIGPE